MSAPKSYEHLEYEFVLDLLRDLRVSAGLSQRALGEKLGRPQTYASDCELGVRRMDVLQLRQWSEACGVGLVEFAQRLEADLAKGVDSPRDKPPQRAIKSSPKAGR